MPLPVRPRARPSRRYAELVERESLDAGRAHRALEPLYPTPLEHGVPDHVRAGCEPPVRFDERFEHVAVLVLQLVRWIDQHEPRRFGRRDEADAALRPFWRSTVTRRSVAELLLEHTVLRGVQLEQIQAVDGPQDLAREPRRARITHELVRAVAIAARELEPARDGRRCVGRVPNPTDAAAVLAILLGRGRAQVVAAGTCVRIDEAQRLVLGRELREQSDQHHVLQNVGVIARVVTV